MRMLLIGSVLMVLMVLMAAADAALRMPPRGRRGKRSTSCSLRYIPTLMTWAAAEKHCQTLGGNLASVHSEQDYQKIQKIIFEATNAHDQTWIGGSDAEQDGIWLWSDGRSFQYTNWCHGEPNNYKGRQDCLQMNHGAKKCWDDLGCDTLRPSVCTTHN